MRQEQARSANKLCIVQPDLKFTRTNPGMKQHGHATCISTLPAPWQELFPRFFAFVCSPAVWRFVCTGHASGYISAQCRMHRHVRPATKLKRSNRVATGGFVFPVSRNVRRGWAASQFEIILVKCDLNGGQSDFVRLVSATFAFFLDRCFLRFSSASMCLASFQERNALIRKKGERQSRT